MSLFDDVLKDGESLFLNEAALDPEWVPKLLPFRDTQQFRIASCIKPLLQGRNGRNCFVSGDPGVGKTAATKWVLRDLEEHSDDVYIVFVNCWQKNSMYKVFVDICEQLGYRFTQNKNTDELFKVIENLVNKKGAVFVFDEIDKVQDIDFLYLILNDILRKSVILITNYASWLSSLEDRVKSRLMPDQLAFNAYSPAETKEILKQRLEHAFPANTLDADAFDLIARKAGEAADVRAGLFLLREAGLAAEDDASRKISLDHAKLAVDKLTNFSTKNQDELDDDSKLILECVKALSESKMGDLFKRYQDDGGLATYKTFQRRIEKLSKGGFVNARKVVGGKEGTTTIVSEKNKDLTDY